MSGDRFDELVREAARSYHAPPAPPREAMWEAIRAARDAAPRRDRDARLALARYRAWAAWGVGIAAVLMVGIGLGRLSVRSPAAPAAAPTAAAPAAAPAAETAYRLAAAQHLGQAEVLLTSFRSEARSGRVDAQVGEWARDLLSTTRLMLDSPASDDPKLRVLLEDLELVLAQIAQIPADGGGAARQEVQIVTDAIEDAGVLPKLRTAIPAGTPLAETEEE